MSMTNLTPDSAVLQQVDGQWNKLAALILWKLAGREKVKVTHLDIARFNKEFAPSMPVLLTHGHSDSIDFQIVDTETAVRLADYDKTMGGTA